MDKLKIEYLKKEELRPYANNAKIHTDEQVEQIKKNIYDTGAKVEIGKDGISFTKGSLIYEDDEIAIGFCN